MTTTLRFFSRAIRANASLGKVGGGLLDAVPDGSRIIPRKIRNLTGLLSQKQEGGLLQRIWNGASALAGFVGGLIKGIAFSATAIWSWVVSGINSLKAFDWNAADTELVALIGDQNLLLASIWGGVVGQGIGWLAGIGVGYGISFLCPVIGGAALARSIALSTAREAVDELLPAIGLALRATATSFARSALISGYINYRRLLKNAPRGLLERLYGKDGADFIQNVWGNKGGPNMSFNTTMDETIERIPNKYVKAFIEEMLEESWDSFTEAGFVVASEIDNAYTQYREAQQDALGPERSITLVPDKENPDEVLTLAKLPQSQMINQVQSLVNTHRLVHNRDIGLVIGQPVDDYIKAKPQTLRLIITMISVKNPPFVKGRGAKLTRATITIPDVKRSAMDWEKIKFACGGSNGYLWGRFRATANLDNGRQMAIYAGSELEAEQRLKAFLSLSDAKILTLSVSEEKKEGRRAANQKLYKESIRVYPTFCTILNREEILDPTKGDASLKQNYLDRKGKINLWTDKEPVSARRTIQRLLTRGI